MRKKLQNKLLLQYPIIYEVVSETGAHQATTKVFRSVNSLGARAKALCYFLDVYLDDYTNPEEQPFIRVYVHDAASGKRVEILNSGLYEHGNDDYSALRLEFELYRTENIQAPVAVLNTVHSHLLSIRPDYKDIKALNVPGAVVFLADNYWLFTKPRKVSYMTA